MKLHIKIICLILKESLLTTTLLTIILLTSCVSPSRFERHYLKKHDKIYSAIYNNNINLLKKSIKDCIDIDNTVTIPVTKIILLETVDRIYNPLLLATYLSNIKVVKELLENNANINVKNEYQETPLFIAANKGNFNLVKLLLEYDANVNIENHNAVSPLYRSIERYNIEITNLLIQKKANLYSENIQKKTILETIAENGISNIKQLSWIINKLDYDVNHKNSWGGTALMQASAMGGYEIVQELISLGANVNMSDNTGKTALMYASHQLLSEVLGDSCFFMTVQLLIKNGAIIDCEDIEGNSVLYYALDGDNETSIRLIKQKLNDSIDKSNSKGLTLLMLAARNGKPYIIEKLIKQGAEIDKIDPDKKTALMYACGTLSASEYYTTHLYTLAVQLLINAGSNIGSSDYNCKSVCNYALEGGNEEIIKLIAKQQSKYLPYLIYL